MWVHFNLLCGRETQQELHKIFRQKIKDWENRGLVKGEVLTYHWHEPKDSKDSLYVCLDIPTVKTPSKRAILIPTETVEQIPSEIMIAIKEICEQNRIQREIIDYEWELEVGESGKKYYHNAPTDEVIRFSSVGTEIALRILDVLESGEKPWASNKELAQFVVSQLKKKLGDDYCWLKQGLHFVCNPLGLDERYIWFLATGEQPTAS